MKSILLVLRDAAKNTGDERLRLHLRALADEMDGYLKELTKLPNIANMQDVNGCFVRCMNALPMTQMPDPQGGAVSLTAEQKAA